MLLYDGGLCRVLRRNGAKVTPRDGKRADPDAGKLHVGGSYRPYSNLIIRYANQEPQETPVPKLTQCRMHITTKTTWTVTTSFSTM